eukprot:scaffold13195_cov52-Phaeocystis_antarctica.AAC.2
MSRGGPSSMKSAVCRRHRRCRRGSRWRQEVMLGEGRRLARPRFSQGPGTSARSGRLSETEVSATHVFAQHAATGDKLARQTRWRRDLRVTGGVSHQPLAHFSSLRNHLITSPPLRAWADNTHREAILLFKDQSVNISKRLLEGLALASPPPSTGAPPLSDGAPLASAPGPASVRALSASASSSACKSIALKAARSASAVASGDAASAASAASAACSSSTASLSSAVALALASALASSSALGAVREQVSKSASKQGKKEGGKEGRKEGRKEVERCHALRLARCTVPRWGLPTQTQRHGVR